MEDADVAEEFGERAKLSVMEAERTCKGCHRNEQVKSAATVEGRAEAESGRFRRASLETCANHIDISFISLLGSEKAYRGAELWFSRQL
jgi:hypothetical protein